MPEEWNIAHRRSIERLSDLEAGQLLKAVTAMQTGEEPPQLARVAALVFRDVVEWFDAKRQLSEVRRAAGRKGGESRKFCLSKTKQNDILPKQNSDLPRQNHTLPKQNDDLPKQNQQNGDLPFDPPYQPPINIPVFPPLGGNTPPLPGGEFPFERFWDAFGYKVDRKRSEAAWKKLSEADRKAAMEAVEGYVKGTFTDGKFPSRKHPLTWVNARCWEDEAPNGKNPKGGKYDGAF